MAFSLITFSGNVDFLERGFSTLNLDSLNRAIVIRLSVLFLVVFPSAAPQLPMVIVLHPFRLTVRVAVTFMFPVPAAPHVMIAMSVPVTGDPNVARARLRNGLDAQRRRRHR
jgi:hypothetical protein